MFKIAPYTCFSTRCGRTLSDGDFSFSLLVRFGCFQLRIVHTVLWWTSMPLDFTELKALFSAWKFGEETLGLYQVQPRPSFNCGTIPMLWVRGKGRTAWTPVLLPQLPEYLWFPTQASRTGWIPPFLWYLFTVFTVFHEVWFPEVSQDYFSV